MTYRLPSSIDFGESTGKAFARGTNLYNMLMQHAVARAQNKRAEEMQPVNIKHILSQISNANAANERAQGLYPEQLKHARNANDPNYEINNKINLIKMLQEKFGRKPQETTLDNGNGNNASEDELMHRQLPDENANPLRDKLKSMGMFGNQQQGQGALLPEELRPLAGDGSMTEEQVDELVKQNANKQPTNQLTDEDYALGELIKHETGYNPYPKPKKSVLHGPARDAADLAQLKKDEGENSEVYQNAKASYDAGVEAKKDLRDLRARTKAGLKPGEKEFFDKTTGAPLGKEIPLTAEERQSEEGNILFNEFYPYVYKGGAPFSGEGSIDRLSNAASNYKTDPKARKMFDDLLLSDKMLAATTVNEASTLKSGKQNRTYAMLKESLEASDIPKLIKKLIKEYNIPASAQLKAAMRYQKILSDARKKAKKGIPATQKLFYDPEMQAKNEAVKEEGTKVINGITYYPDGQGGWEHD